MFETIKDLLDDKVNKIFAIFLVIIYLLGYFVVHAYLREFNYHSYNIFALKYFTAGFWVVFFTIYYLLPLFTFYYLFVSPPKKSKKSKRKHHHRLKKGRNFYCYLIRIRRFTRSNLAALNSRSIFFFNMFIVVLLSTLFKFDLIISSVNHRYSVNSLSALILVSPIIITIYHCALKKPRKYVVDMFSIMLATLSLIQYLNVWGIHTYQTSSFPNSDFSDGSGIKPVEVYLSRDKQGYFDEENVSFENLCWLETEGNKLIFVRKNAINDIETLVLNSESIELLVYPDKAEWSCPTVSHSN